MKNDKLPEGRKCFGVVECPECGKMVKMYGEASDWEFNEKKKKWVISDYGPGIAIHCGGMIVDNTDGFEWYDLKNPAKDKETEK